MLKAIVPPLVAAYIVFVAMVVLAWRRPAEPRTRWREDTSAPIRVSTGSLLVMAIGGYVVFLAIVLIFHVWLAEESGVLLSAVWGGPFLVAVAVGASSVITIALRWLNGRKVDRRQGGSVE